MVAFFTRSGEQTLARGVYRSYQQRQERLKTIRGRIDLPAQFAQAGAAYPVGCRFREHTPNVIENRYLKAGIRQALRVPEIQAGVRQRLRRLLTALEEVSDVPVRPGLLDEVVFNRLQSHYEPTLRLARLLLENLTLQDETGDAVASSFMIDMNFLFESFVTHRLRGALRGRLEVESQHSTHLDLTDRVIIKPDLVFRRFGAPVFVGDLKYKLRDEPSKLPTSDLYQMLAYTTALGLPNGVLVYCRDSDGRATHHDEITVRHTDKVLHAWGIDMSGPPDSVEDEIRKLADWIADRAGRARRTWGLAG